MVASRERQGRGGPPKKFLIRGLIDISLVVTLPFIHNSIRQRRRGVVEEAKASASREGESRQPKHLELAPELPG